MLYFIVHYFITQHLHILRTLVDIVCILRSTQAYLTSAINMRYNLCTQYTCHTYLCLRSKLRSVLRQFTVPNVRVVFKYN